MLYKELVIGDKTYKCRLSAANVISLEEKLGYNPVNAMLSGDVPSLRLMLELFHSTLLPYNHKLKFEDACSIYDEYCDIDDNDQTSFFFFLMKVLQNNGYVSKSIDFDNVQEKIENNEDAALKEVNGKN